MTTHCTVLDVPSIQGPTDWDGLASMAPARNSTGQSCIHLLWVWSDLTYLGQLAPRHIVGGPRAWSEPHRRHELLGAQQEARICWGGGTSWDPDTSGRSLVTSAAEVHLTSWLWGGKWDKILDWDEYLGKILG